MYEYAARLVRVVDGDTLVLILDLGFSITRTETVRVAGVDTSELNSPDPLVRAAAQIAKSFVEAQLSGAVIKVQTAKPYPTDKYGRYLATVLHSVGTVGEWKNLTEQLLFNGHAKPYSGGARVP
jgi:micrococcal nuclease